MSYIGSTPSTQSFTSGTDYFNGTGSQTAFTLTRLVNSVNDIEVVINNVVQQPNAAYNLSGYTITFTSAPSAGTQNIYVRYLTTILNTISVSPDTIGLNELSATGTPSASTYLRGDNTWASVGAINNIFYQNGNTVAASYTIPTNTNAGSFGPVTIATGVDVVISDNANWVIV